MLNRLIINSFVFTNITKKSVLFYNTINHQYVSSNNIEIVRYLNKNRKKKNNSFYWTINIEIASQAIKKIIYEIEKKNIGQFINIQKRMPILFSPSLSIDDQHIEEYMLNFMQRNNNSNNKEKENVLGKNIINNIKEITVHYNKIISLPNIYENSYKQYLFPIKGDSDTTINTDLFINWVNVNILYPIRINLIIGNISANNLQSLNQFIYKLSHIGDVHIYLYEPDILFLTEIKFNKTHIYIWVLPNNDINKYNDWNKIGLFTNDKEYKYYYNLNNNKLLGYYPLYLKNNLNYCKKLLSFNIKDALNVKPTERDIFSHMYINSNFFGEFVVNDFGDVFSCINYSSIGNIKENTLKELVLKELKAKGAWFKTRRSIKKCKECAFNIICPPITKIEISLGENEILCSQPPLVENS